MSDPSTANSRVFVGNIPTNDMTKKDLEDKFKKYGPILGKLRCNMTFTYWVV
jgi:RNA recognition motif-containing protein